jgi:hypothetical protein
MILVAQRGIYSRCSICNKGCKITKAVLIEFPAKVVKPRQPLSDKLGVIRN